MSTIDVAAARAETAGADTVLHFNNAGAGLMPKAVRDAIVAHLDLESIRGSYESARLKQAELDDLYVAVAELLRAESPDEIAILESATHAWCQAFYAIPFKSGDVVITSHAEYGANIVAMLQLAKRIGIVVEVVEAEASGALSLTHLEALLAKHGDRIKCIAVTHIPTNGGLVNPCEAIGALVAKHKVPYFLVDACQTAGQLDIDVNKLGCNLLSATSRKYLRGPRGIGFLYVKRDILETLEPVTIDHFGAPWTSKEEYTLRPNAKRFEKWESCIANRMGLRVAVRYALQLGTKNIEVAVKALARELREKLSTAGIKSLDLGVEQCGIVTFNLDGMESTAVQAALSKRDVNVSVSTAAVTRLDMDVRGIKSVVRASVHYYNTSTEVDRFVAEVADVQEKNGA